MNTLEEKIYRVISDYQLANLATLTEEGKPWGRYVMTRGEKDLTIRFSTILHLRKIAQIKKNPEVHLHMGSGNLSENRPYLQVQGRAFIDTDMEEKKKFWNEGLSEFLSGPEDPGYVLIKVEPYLIEYTVPMNPGPPEVWTKK